MRFRVNTIPYMATTMAKGRETHAALATSPLAMFEDMYFIISRFA